MYSRNRQSQSYTNVRNQNNPNTGSFQGSNSYNQGSYQAQPGNQQGNYKPSNAPNSQLFKPQSSPQQQAQMQQSPVARPMQQMKPQTMPSSPQQQQQQQQPQQQQQQHQPSPPTPPPQPQRLKPILKQTSHTPNPTSVQNSPTSTSQPPPAQPAPSTPSVPPASATPTPTPTPATSTPATPAPVNNTETKNDNSKPPENTDVETQEPPRWRRKVPGFKVNKKLKRLRMNQRLRKTLQPKNAIMVLNEMKAGVQFTFPETQGPMPNSLYLVHAELDGKTYVGQGLSKPLARQNAAENALKALLHEKMTAATMKASIDAESDGQANQSADSVKDDGYEESSTSTSNMETSIDENDEIPWSSLASFALYKLFLEWHNQGTSVPVPRPGLPSLVKGVKREVASSHKAPVQKELPPNATNIHPVMLLNQMRPGLTYVELNRAGNPPNTMFTLAVEVDGEEYTGTAKNKKDAKKIAAKAALLALYGLTYPDDD